MATRVVFALQLSSVEAPLAGGSRCRPSRELANSANSVWHRRPGALLLCHDNCRHRCTAEVFRFVPYSDVPLRQILDWRLGPLSTKRARLTGRRSRLAGGHRCQLPAPICSPAYCRSYRARPGDTVRVQISDDIALRHRTYRRGPPWMIRASGGAYADPDKEESGKGRSCAPVSG